VERGNKGNYSKDLSIAPTAKKLTPTYTLVNANWTDLFWVGNRKVFLDQEGEDDL
jgi:hypothetical protein